MHKDLKVKSKDRGTIVDKALAGLIPGQRTKDPSDLRIKRNGHPPDGPQIEINTILQCKSHRGGCDLGECILTQPVTSTEASAETNAEVGASTHLDVSGAGHFECRCRWLGPRRTGLLRLTAKLEEVGCIG